MPMEILNGTIDPAEPVSSKRGYMVFDTLRFRDRAGVERMLRKIWCGGDVAGLVRKGGTGRYYLSSGAGQTGIHGVRLDDGTSAYAHYTNMEMIVLIGILAGVVALLIGIANGTIMYLPLLAGAVLVAIYVTLRAIRTKAKRQFDADGEP